MSVETDFIKWLCSRNIRLNKDKIKRHNSNEHQTHIRFSRGCGINTPEEFIDLMQSVSFTQTSTGHLSKKYKIGGLVKWGQHDLHVLYGVAKSGESERKRWTPESLGLAGFETNSVADFKDRVIRGLRNINETEIAVFENLIDNIINKTPIVDTEFIKVNKSIITSDFGEVLAALQDVCDGHTILFPNVSNQKVIDYYIIDQPEPIGVSVKNPDGGGKVNLSDFVNFINPNESIYAKILYCIASHDRDGLFESVATVCPRVKAISEMIGGLKESNRINFVQTHSYDDFYDSIKSNQLFVKNKLTLGVPKEQDWKDTASTPRSLWASDKKVCLEPLDFTLNTLIARFWGTDNHQHITDVVRDFLSKPQFKIVNIQNKQVTIDKVNFADIKQWKLAYWSRATKAWHNWISVAPLGDYE